MKNHYKEKFWEYSTDELKDIIAGRFREYDEAEVAAAIELLKERREGSITTPSELSLAQIPAASLPVLLEIVKNPQIWSKDALEIAEAEILRREKEPEPVSRGSSNNALLKGVLGIMGLIGAFILVKLIAALVLIAFFFYLVESCLSSL